MSMKEQAITTNKPHMLFMLDTSSCYSEYQRCMETFTDNFFVIIRRDKSNQDQYLLFVLGELSKIEGVFRHFRII